MAYEAKKTPNVRQYEVVKGYVPTSVPTGSYGNYNISNGTVKAGGSLIDRGYSNYPNAYDGSRQAATPLQPTKTGDSKSTGGSVKSGATGASSGALDSTANAYNALLAAYRQNDYSDYLRQMREAAQNAYDRGMGALNSAYDAQMNSLSNNLNETRSQLENQYNRSKTSIGQDAENSLRQAYINNMMNRKNLAQQMSAQGLNGGATETTMANLLNNYGNARNNINTTMNNNLSELEGNYSDNLSQAMQAYNSAVANANLQKAQQAMSLENALANNQISALGDYQTLMQRENQNYLDLLKTAIANGASFNYNPTQANNAVQGVSVQQANSTPFVNNLAALQALMGQNTPGTNTPGVTVVNTPTQADALADFIARIRG